MIDESSFKSKALKTYFETGSTAKLKQDLVERITDILEVLDCVEDLKDFSNYPALKFHPLQGNRKDTYSLKVSGNWRMTFKWNDAPYDIDLEDYH